MRAVFSRAAALLLAALLLMSAGACACAEYEAAEAIIPVGGIGSFWIKEPEAEDGEAFDTLELDGSGSFTLSFVEPDDYSYVVFSTDPENPARYNVLVRVLTDESDSLTAHAVVSELESGRKVPAALYPVTENPPLEKQLIGDTPPAAESFHFLFRAVSTTAEGLQGKLPMPEGSDGQVKRLTVLGAGETEAGEIRFDRAGTYVYEFSEEKGSARGYRYDDSIYRVSFLVTESEEGFRVEKTMTKNGAAAESFKAVFTNSYRASASPKTGDDTRLLPYALALGLSGLFLLIPVIGNARRNKGREKA